MEESNKQSAQQNQYRRRINPESEVNHVGEPFVEADPACEQIAQETIPCVKCGHQSEHGAKYCEECSQPLDEKTCRFCGSTIFKAADFCKHCGKWLTDNTCKFCGGEVSSDDSFCPECGNPTAGLICPRCNQNSFFSFCTFCNQPLTEEAKQQVEKIRTDPEYQKYQQSIFTAEEKVACHEKIDANLPALPASPKKKMFSDEYLRHLIERTQAIEKDMADEKRRHEEEEQARRQKEAEKRRLIDEQRRKMMEEAIRKERELERIQCEMAAKTFANNRGARSYHNSCRPSGPGKWAWRCNRYDVYHYDGPNGCDAACLGGVWEDIEGRTDLKFVNVWEIEGRG